MKVPDLQWNYKSDPIKDVENAIKAIRDVVKTKPTVMIPVWMHESLVRDYGPDYCNGNVKVKVFGLNGEQIK